MIALDRNGLLVLYGKVSSFDETSLIIAHQNRKVRILFENEPQHIKLGVKEGCKVICSTTSSFLFDCEKDGASFGELPEVNGYILRYTGSFDFDRYEDLEEEHCFCGSVTDVKKFITKTGVVTTLIVLSWKHNHVDEYRKVYFKEDIVSEIGTRVVVTTKEVKEKGTEKIFIGQNIFKA